MAKTNRKKSFLQKFKGTIFFKIVIITLAVLMFLGTAIGLIIQLANK